MFACSLPDILGRRRTPSNTLVRPPGFLLSFVIRGLRFAQDWQKSCYWREPCDSGSSCRHGIGLRTVRLLCE